MANLNIGRRSGLVLRGGRNVRQTRWIDSPTIIQSTIVAASTAVLVHSLAAPGLALIPFTVTRTIAYLWTRSDNLFSTELTELFYGQCVVSEQAEAIGITAVPTPLTDAGSDLWFLHMLKMGDTVSQGTSGYGTTQPQMIMDSRAQRKVVDGEQLIGVFETGNASNGVVGKVFFRQLIKLH